MKAEQIEKFNLAVREGIGDKAKSLQLSLYKLFGWRRSIQWIYNQGGDFPDRDSIVQRFLKFMCALKRANFQGYEFLKLEIDLFLNSVEMAGHPQLGSNPVLDAVKVIESEVRKVKRLLKLN